MGKLALVGLSTALGTTLGALSVLAGQRIGFLPVPPTPGDPWQAVGDPDRAPIEPAPGTSPGSAPASAPEPASASASAPKTALAPANEPVRYLSVGEVAERLGVTTAEITKDAGLPEPDATVGRTRGWLETTIDRSFGEGPAREGGRAES